MGNTETGILRLILLASYILTHSGLLCIGHTGLGNTVTGIL